MLLRKKHFLQLQTNVRDSESPLSKTCSSVQPSKFGCLWKFGLSTDQCYQIKISKIRKTEINMFEFKKVLNFRIRKKIGKIKLGLLKIRCRLVVDPFFLIFLQVEAGGSFERN